MKRTLLSTVAALCLLAGGAHATCISAVPIAAPAPTDGTACSITAASSTIDIVFAYKAAADIDLLLNGATILISNTDPIGTHVTLTGVTPGDALDFSFRDVSDGDTFRPGVAALADGRQHVAVEASISDFESDPPRSFLTTADLGPALSVMSGIGPLGEWVFAGLEDRIIGSDFDFNDLIFAFRGIGVNEPSTLAILGLGLIGLAGLPSAVPLVERLADHKLEQEELEIAMQAVSRAIWDLKARVYEERIAVIPIGKATTAYRISLLRQCEQLVIDARTLDSKWHKISDGPG